MDGTAHLLEHVVCRGTVHFSGKQLATVLDEIGAQFQSCTAAEYTLFCIRLPTPHIPIAFQLLSDMVCYPLLARKDVAIEKGVVVEGIRRRHDRPSTHLSSLAHTSLFPHHALGREVSGTIQDVQDNCVEHIRHFWNTHYVPSQLTIVACGAFGEFVVPQLAEKYFHPQCAPSRDIQKLVRRRSRCQTLPPVSRQKYIHLLRPFHVNHTARPTHQCHVVIGFTLPFGYSTHEMFLAHILADLIGGYMSSRIWRAIRVTEGIAHKVRTKCTFFKDAGTLTLEMGLQSTSCAQGVLIALHELSKIHRGHIRSSEVNTAKGYRIGRLFMQSEQSQDLGAMHAMCMLYNKPLLSVEERAAKYRAVTLQQIQRLARTALAPNCGCLHHISSTSLRPALRQAILQWPELRSEYLAELMREPTPSEDGCARASPGSHV